MNCDAFMRGQFVPILSDRNCPKFAGAGDAVISARRKEYKNNSNIPCKAHYMRL